MRYICKMCGKNYSGDNIPLNKRCKKCNARLENATQNETPLNEVNKAICEADKPNNGEIYSKKNVDEECIINEKRKYVSPYREEAMANDSVIVRKESIKKISVPIENSAVGTNDDLSGMHEIHRIVGEVNESDTIENARRRIWTTKISNALKYGQSMSDTYNRIIVNTREGQRVSVVFYGDSPLGQNTFKKGAKIEATGKFNKNNEFMAKSITVDGVWVRITNELRRGAASNQQRRSRTGVRFLILLLAVCAFFSIANKIYHMGFSNFFVTYLCIGVVVGWGTNLLLNVLFANRQERNRRWGIAVGIIAAIVAMVG